jgi:Helix-turn-helix domain
MGRLERPLNPESGPQQLFAAQLRQLREHAGRPTYRAMAAVVNYSAPALSRAAAGERFPTLDVTLAFVHACGGDEPTWRLRWQQAYSDVMAQRPGAAIARDAAQHDGTTDGQALRDGLARCEAVSGANRARAADVLVNGREFPAARRGWPQVLAAALRRNRLAVLLAVTMTAALVNLVLTVHGASQSGSRAATDPNAALTGLRPVDGADPYISRCGSDQVRVEQRTWPISWPDGKPYGRLALYHSRACQASWGYVYGPNSATWTVVITARRQGQDPASAPSSFRGSAPPDSWGNLLSDRTGCVQAEAYVVAADGRRGATAMTGCWQGSGPVYHER